jgi:glutamyl-tRNA reductase
LTNQPKGDTFKPVNDDISIDLLRFGPRRLSSQKAGSFSMKLFMVGVDHTSAPVALRERLAFDETNLTEALHALTVPGDQGDAVLREAVILSTCNRVEIYGVATGDVEQVMTAFLADFHQLDPIQFRDALFFHYGPDVVHHLFETTTGLRSIVLGEAQIQGQVRRAFSTAQRVRSVGPVLTRLFSRSLVTGKRVRRETSLGEGAASVSQAGIALAEQQLGSLEGCTVLLVGSGKVSELAAQNLLAYGARNLIVVNRTYDNARNLAARYGAQAYPFEDLMAAMVEADIVISSTAAPFAVITQSMVEEVLAEKAACVPVMRSVGAAVDTIPAPDLLLIDLAVPRDIMADVADLPAVSLYTVDDLRSVIDTTMMRRGQAVAEARLIVAEEYDDFMAWMRIQETMPVLSSWRQQAEAMRDAELKRALRRMSELSPEDQHVLEAFSRSLVNKLLHSPTLRTRHAAAAGDGQRYADMLRDLWSL